MITNQGRRQHSREAGFTLVELLIVVIILGILAAIVVPQFGASTDDARATALESNLAGLRSQVDLYYQHHGSYPSSSASSGGAGLPVGANPGTGAADQEQAFLDQMTLFTNMAGQASTIKDTVYKYGPYLKSATFPPMPYTDINTVNIQTTGALDHTGAAAPGAGWLFDNISGQFIADHDSYDHL
jgi:general secretion pathway protein G